MKEDALFCVGQKTLIERDGKVLVMNDPVLGLDYPGGKIQEGEAKSDDFGSLVEALKREVREETDLEIDVRDPFTVMFYQYSISHRNFGKNVYIVFFKSTYVSGEVTLSHEHDSFRWVGKDNYMELDDESDYFGVLRKYFEG